MFSFLKMDRATEMKLRLKKARTARMYKQTLRIISENRVRRYQESLSTIDIVSEVLSDTVDAVCADHSAPKPRMSDYLVSVKSEEKKSEIPEETRAVIPVTRKRANRVDTWYERGYAIYMLLIPRSITGTLLKLTKTQTNLPILDVLFEQPKSACRHPNCPLSTEVSYHGGWVEYYTVVDYQLSLR